MYGESKIKKELDYFVIMDAKWWMSFENDKGKRTCSMIPHELTSYDGNSKTRFVLFSDNEDITIEAINKSAEFHFTYNGAKKVHSYHYYQGSKVDTIRSAISELPEDAIYLVLDEENLYAEFPGRSVMLDMDNYKTSLKKACRYMHNGYWWNYQHRLDSFRHKDIIEDGFENVIFLDVDGVLNTDDYNDPIRVQEDRVALLADIVKTTGAEIVLSSSWRRSIASWISNPVMSPDGRIDWGYELIKLLAKYDLTIAGMTEDLHSGPDARPLEIRSWLAKRTEIFNFVILDDEDFWTWRWLSPHVVTTSERVEGEEGWPRRVAGLEPKHVGKAIEILSLYSKPKRKL